jgi:hypothetical protein
MEIPSSQRRANPQSTDTDIAHRITFEICDLPSDDGSRLQVKDQVCCALARWQQDRRRLLTAGRLNEAGMLDGGHVPSRFKIVDLEPTLCIGCVRELAIGLASARAELHTCLPNRLAPGLL